MQMIGKRTVGTAAAALLTLALGAGPAAAHHLTVDPPGEGGVKENWVGGPILPEAAGGQGLMDGPPFLPGSKQAPAHSKGLNTACLRLEANPSVVDIRGPAGPGGTGCAHGGFDPQ
jgi:hypothetical protein